MKLATWNVNSLTARLARVEPWIRENEPDVLCLQETKQDDAKFPFEQLAALGYESVHHGEGRWNGVAILSRVGIEDVQRGFGDVEDEFGARFIAASCGGVRIASCYVPNGRALDDPFFEKKLAWLDRLCDYASGHEDPLVLCGDFNVAPRDEDVWDPAALVGMTHVTDEERSRIERLLQLGLVDVVRAQHPDETIFSWWDYRNGSFHRGFGMRIDLVLASTPIAACVTSAYVDREARKGEKPSDHAPVVVEWDS